MTTQESQFECNVNIHFIVPDHLESENDCSEEMWQAFNKCSEFSLEPEWITEKMCDKMKPSKNDIFIIEEFSGTLFEKIQNFKCSIVSPKCLLICFLNGEPIPEGKNPIYTTAMRGMCICVSGVTPELKKQIQKRVEYMGGFFTKQLRSSVTHLVADSVMSEKYEGALKMKIPIMKKEWVEAVWEENLKNVTQANDKMFDKYKCPVFMNLIVTSTNLPKRQKEEIKRLIHDHGGTFMGPLDGTKVRVVFASKSGPMSDKLKYALENNIACLQPDWIYESIKVGHALPFHNFIIKSVKACSTPEKSHIRETLNCSNISSISHDKHYNNYINETYSSTVSNFSTVDAISNNFSNNIMLNVLDRLTFSEVKSAGPFLDGCNIYLVGFAANIKDKLNRIINVSGATRFDDISGAVTHVIVGDENKASAKLKTIKSSGLCPHILNIEWLEESMKLKRPAPEDRFLFEVKNGTPKKNVETPASPLSQKNLQMLQKSKRPPIPPFNLEKEPVPANEKEQSDLVQQYLQKTNDTWITEYSNTKSILQDKDGGNSSNVSEIRSNITPIKNAAEESSVPLSQSCTINEKLLRGLTFVVADFDNEDNNVKETIEMLGGYVVSKTYSGIPDYGIVPLQGTPLKHTVNEIVTDLFIEDCINQERIVDIMYYHKPFSIRKSCSPLSECVITMSMYTGTERIYLSALAKELGAICQDMFARKANTEKKTRASTHLVCPIPEGDKYNAAVRWKLPAVTADWLKTCADQLTLADETPFLVGETMAPDRPNTNTSETTFKQITPSTLKNGIDPAEETVRTPTTLTSKRHLSQIEVEMNSIDSPLMKKIRDDLGFNKISNSFSPFHIRTPDSPLGQVFTGPNPSPKTRKFWAKWLDDLPYSQVKEPPLKRRAPSTPLSELKIQLWEKLKNAGQNNPTSEVTSNDDSFAKKAEEGKADQFSKDAPSTSDPINRKLDFDEENSPLSNDEINMQIAKLDQMLQQTRTPENRYSMSGESTKKYNEASDDIQKCIIKDSQPIDAIVWEDPNQPKRLTLDKQTNENIRNNIINEHIAEKDINELPMIRRFMLSGIKDKAMYEQVIQNLGGEVSTDPKYDNSATHLLCIRLSRNEKMLGSIAAGKWLLHTSYLRDCEREGKFLNEEKYEWGNPKSKDVIPEPSSSIEQAIAAAAHKWRLRLQKKPDGPFCDMVALLMVSEDKYDQFKRLIEAGGGSVTQARPPYDVSSSGRRITHCFVNVRQVNQPVDWAMLASKGILCFLPQYLSDYLMAEEPLNPRDCVLPEFKKYLTLLPK
ncbi:DNA topoisomerase 2-binding protein 1-A isoform X3 [Camponotus floridanus]|uniref:DNA topoisomerase 2-binding protein 1-A isoform X3 n=1 Tax=Camponotus floridanus TaxID=104421 RepID=UPI000DC6C761|nr:DNA topoisomerase 2-binding protein 1-A isoform X3 [Camponotus floridanus]